MVDEDVDLVLGCNCMEKCHCLDLAEDNIHMLEDKLVLVSFAQNYLTIIRRRRGDYRGIFTETK
jgi:hypothetical protein